MKLLLIFFFFELLNIKISSNIEINLMTYKKNIYKLNTWSIFVPGANAFSISIEAPQFRIYC